jgi:pimeloyl-ACP methyl ester carboxylesterase
MKKGWEITLIVLASLLFLILVVPLLVPVPPAKRTLPVEALADPDSQFIEVKNIRVHYKQTGSGEPVFILLHGFGASTFSWREVMQPLSKYGTVIAYDRPGFGLTERSLEWEEENPYTLESNVELLRSFMDAKGIEQAIIAGSSAGGTVATAFTIAHPERIQALIEVDAAIYQTVPRSRLLTWLLHTPQVDHIAPLLLRLFLNENTAKRFLSSAWYDTSIIEENPEIMKGYTKPFMADNWDRALWEHTLAAQPPDFIDQLDEIQVPTLVVGGEFSQLVPIELSQRLAQDIPNATLVVIPDCGHLPHEECPITFLDAVDNFMKTIKEINNE